MISRVLSSALDDLDDVAVAESGCRIVDADTADGAAEFQSVEGLDDVAPRGLLVVRRNGIFQVRKT